MTYERLKRNQAVTLPGDADDESSPLGAVSVYCDTAQCTFSALARDALKEYFESKFGLTLEMEMKRTRGRKKKLVKAPATPPPKTTTKKKRRKKKKSTSLPSREEVEGPRKKKTTKKKRKTFGATK